jgi:ribulose-phosphate 3-epimerase
MALICPTVTAYDPHEYRAQIELLEPFAKRMHIDLMDGEFAPHISPNLEQIWWPPNIIADLHLMYHRPMDSLEQVIKLRPNLAVIHFEAEVDHAGFAAELHGQGIKAGLAIVQSTTVGQAIPTMRDFDQVMVYSGNLGEHGGMADLRLLDKVRQIHAQYPGIEISWDGGINDQNAKQLVDGGVDVLNVGAFIQKSPDPRTAYKNLVEKLEEA